MAKKQKNKTTTGAAGYNAGFPGKDKLSGKPLENIKDKTDKVIKWSGKSKGVVPPMDKNNDHKYWE